MLLVNAQIGPFRSINSVQEISIDPKITVFVGMNEAGKTVFLKGLQKSNDALSSDEFEVIEDYPRKNLTSYLKTHKSSPEKATQLTYRLSDEEIININGKIGCELESNFEFSVTKKYDNTRTIHINVDEKPVIANLLKNNSLSSDCISTLKKANSIREIPVLLKEIELNDSDKKFLDDITLRIKETSWGNIIQFEVWKKLDLILPKFLYFSDYDILPGKLNIRDLARRVSLSDKDPSQLTPKHKAILALLRMADIEMNELTNSDSYEELKAKIEGVSINLTDQIMDFWKQNEEIEVEIDIKNDEKDEIPFNDGPNLYLRIKNRRHRGVSTPFDKRSRGFIWFFSFLVWFDSVQYQIDAGEGDKIDLILLLDEPALALHAMAQSDFLKYIDKLSENHQVLYTTHSPFMVHSDRLHQVRMVEDKDNIGTSISDNLSGSDPRTIFPLQAALGWNVAQNLFISRLNLLVEGPSELIYLKHFSNILLQENREGLDDNITIVPTGGLDKIVTFVALLGANDLKIAVLHDYSGRPEQKLNDLVKSKIISGKLIFNTSQFLSGKNDNAKASDIEDLISIKMYLTYFNNAFENKIPKKIIESDLPQGDRIVERIERYLKLNNIEIRPTGGFNHYLVAACFGATPPKKIDAETLNRFERLFKDINKSLI
ncbi:AAA family ATPase [Rahnella aceris]|uniref:ATP-dependent endonuclease n=1 Tax=Rahnella sp. (strain Y9602) TaxID=2703885 RepID=A0ABW6C6P0_RAHSY